jgi:hypothetical protein
MMTIAWSNLRKVFRFGALSLAIVCGLASILATGGGGGGGSSSTGGTSTSGGTGSVALLMADGAADDYDHIYVFVTKVSLIPASGSSQGPVVIFQSASATGHKVDLLAYRDEDFLLGIKGDIPAGQYERIRLEVDHIEAVGGTCDLEMIKLPSGKIDLNPQSPFEVRSGEALAIRLDIDANKSINLHPAGKSGKCIFRPVVFVDIKPVTVPRPCPLNVTGTITAILDRNQDGTTDSFILNLTGPRGPVEVLLGTDSRVFDANGLPATPGVLALGQGVWVNGRLDTQGRLQALVVVVGDVLAVDGIVQDVVTVQDNTGVGVFPFLPDPGQEVVGGPINVQVFENYSVVFRGCEAQVGWAAIARDVPARVVGKFLSNPTDELRAAVVFVKQVEISGQVVAFSDATEGRYLSVQTDSGAVKTVLVPKTTLIFLEGDGSVPLELVCTGRKVRILVDPNATQLTASQVKVQADLLEGTVTGISGGNTLLVKPDGQTASINVHVPDGTTIIDQRSDDDKLLSFGDIQVGNQVKVFGLGPGPCNTMFEASVILIVGP